MPYLFTNILALQVKSFAFHNNNNNYFFSHTYHFEYQKNIFIVNKKNVSTTDFEEKKVKISKQNFKYQASTWNNFCKKNCDRL
jgi:hypothetical protein